MASGGSGRGRALLVLVAVVAFIGLALLEPWETPWEASVPPTPTPAVAETPAGLPSPTRAAADPTPLVGQGPVTYDDWQSQLAAVVRDRPEWGLRVIVADAAVRRPTPRGRDPRLIAETWHAFSPADLVGPLLIDGLGGQVVAIGVTSPSSQAVLDVRVWRLAEGMFEYVPAERASLPGRAVEAILLPPADTAGVRVWQPGRYRFDALSDGVVLRIPFEVDGELPARPPDERGPAAPSDDELAGALGGLTGGALAISVPSIGMPTITCLDSEPGVAVEGAEAWLDVERGPVVRGTCAEPRPVDEPQVLALLVVDGERLTRASLARLEPVTEHLGEGAILDTRPPGVGGAGEGRLALFRAPAGEVWRAGTYRIDAEWRDAGRDRTGSWLLDVYPAPRGAEPVLVTASRRAARVAGSWTIGGGLFASPAAQVPDSVPSDSGQLGRTCTGARIIGPEPAVIAGYRGRGLARASIWRIFGDGSLVELDAFTVVDALPGAVVFAPVGDTVWRSGYYAVRLWPEPSRSGLERAERTLVFCVGAFEPNGELIVPVGVDDVLDFVSLE